MTPKIAYIPGVGSTDLLALLADPSPWDWSLVDEFGLCRQHVMADTAEKAVQLKVGPNTWGAFRQSSAIEHLAARGVPLTLETGCLKEWDPTGHILASDASVAIDRVRRQGGRVTSLNLDEPLASCVRGRTDREAHLPGYRYPYTQDEVHLVSQHTAGFVRRMADEHGVTCSLWEAWPQHPTDRLIPFVRHIVDDERTPLRRFILDFDHYAGVTRDNELAETIGELQEMCRELDIEFAVSTHVGRATSPANYMHLVHDWLADIQRTGWPDWLVVTSWGDIDAGHTSIPLNLPADDPASHTGILRHTAAMAGRSTP